MDHQDKKIDLLLLKLADLAAKQQSFEAEINLLKQEIRHLQFPTEEPYLKNVNPTPQVTSFPQKNKKNNTRICRGNSERGRRWLLLAHP